MSSIIQLLPDHVANQIAAGEVVQRPASVVKELLENAVDAKSTDIKLIVKDSGKTLIQVIDNGLGMSITDARLCFERHATSKIKHAEDLFAINTKGFRGEALASIAAVAHVELKTKQDQEELGTHVVIEGSQFLSQEPIVQPKGTSFLVKNLFYNIPARRNFLKTDSLELKHIINEFQRVALTHPNIHFSLLHNSTELFLLPASNLRQRIVNIFGSKTNEKLVPIAENTEVVSIQGFVMRPEHAKKTRGEQFFFVNHRYIKSSYFHQSVLSSFEGLLRDGHHPSYFIYLEVPPHTIDINIHPTKTEIKFEDEHTIYAILRAAIKHSLGQYQVAPVLDFNADPNLEVPYHQNKQSGKLPEIDFNQNFNPFQSNVSEAAFKTAKTFTKTPESQWDGLYAGIPEASQDVFESQHNHSQELFDDNTFARSSSSYAQIKQKYIIASLKNNLIVVHQNRAHQRVLYEELLQNMTNFSASPQQLLFPINVQMEVIKVSKLLELQPVLSSVGFVFESSLATELIFNALPAFLEPAKLDSTLQDLLVALEDPEQFVSKKHAEMIAMALAKSMSLKTGTHLTTEAMEHLINQLFACQDPYVCPFKKPIIQTITFEEIDQKFKL